VAAYRDGAPPEEIVKRFPDLSLPDAYAVVGYVLRHPREVEAYLDERRQAAEAIRREIEAKHRPRNNFLGLVGGWVDDVIPVG